MQHTATHCNTWITKLKIILPWDSRLQHAATRCNALHTRTRCNTWIEKNPEDTILGNTLQHTAAHCNTMQHLDNVALEDICIGATRCGMLQHTATHCNTLQHTAMHCNIHIHTAAHCNTLQHTATHCNTLQHTAAHCNTWITKPQKILYWPMPSSLSPLSFTKSIACGRATTNTMCT